MLVDMKLWVVAILDLSEVMAVMVDMEIILGGTVDILEAEAMVDAVEVASAVAVAADAIVFGSSENKVCTIYKVVPGNSLVI